MIRGMYSAVSGLRTHQTMIDVTANNLANVGTVAFKAARTTFQDAYYQTLRSGSSAQDSVGGISPTQVGTGVSVGATTILVRFRTDSLEEYLERMEALAAVHGAAG